MSPSRLAMISLVLAAGLQPGIAHADKPFAPPADDPTVVACSAALDFCYAACAINDEHNNTGGFQGLPLLSFKNTCESKCNNAYDQCIGAEPPPRQNQSTPVHGRLDDFGSSSSGQDNGDYDEGKGGFDRGHVMNPTIFDGAKISDAMGNALGNLQ